MKTTYKVIRFLVLVLVMNSCNNDKNPLTKEYVLEYLKQIEVEQPIVFKNRMYPVFINSKEELNNSGTYYKQLYKNGYIDAILKTDLPNPEISSRPYQVILKEKAQPYVLDKKTNGIVEVITLEFNAVEVKEIRVLNDFKAEADVVYKKTRTPFHNTKKKDVSKSGKEYPKETHTKTLEFRKNQSTNEWKSPIKIMF